MQPVPTAPTAAEDGGLSTHVLHMTRLHAKRPLLVELRVINGPFEGGCRLQSGAGAWLACNTSDVGEDEVVFLIGVVVGRHGWWRARVRVVGVVRLVADLGPSSTCELTRVNRS